MKKANESALLGQVFVDYIEHLTHIAPQELESRRTWANSLRGIETELDSWSRCNEHIGGTLAPADRLRVAAVGLASFGRKVPKSETGLFDELLNEIRNAPLSQKGDRRRRRRVPLPFSPGSPESFTCYRRGLQKIAKGKVGYARFSVIVQEEYEDTLVAWAEHDEFEQYKRFIWNQDVRPPDYEEVSVDETRKAPRRHTSA